MDVDCKIALTRRGESTIRKTRPSPAAAGEGSQSMSINSLFWGEGIVELLSKQFWGTLQPYENLFFLRHPHKYTCPNSSPQIKSRLSGLMVNMDFHRPQKTQPNDYQHEADNPNGDTNLCQATP
jgi:hypothetical protein